MPAEMMTKVWPSPNRTTGVIATRMFCELRTVTKVAELNTGTEMTKKRIIRARKHHAHSSLTAISARLPGDTVDFGDADALVACLLYTSPSPRDRQKSRMPSSA